MINAKQQRGVTFLGWLLILALIGIFATATLRLLPIYMEYYRINSVLTGLKVERANQGTSKKEIRDYLTKRFDVESINRMKPTDIKVTAKDENWRVRANYEARAPFIGNVDFIVSFDKSVEVAR
jgi:hypothetical protein